LSRNSVAVCVGVAVRGDGGVDGDGGGGWRFRPSLQTKSKTLAPSAGPKLFIRRAYTLAATTTTWRLAISGILTPCTASV